MAIPHYIFMLLKMLGKTGVLTFHGDLKKSYECDQEASEYASTSREPDGSAEVFVAAQQLSQSEMAIPTKKSSQSSVKPTSNIRVKATQMLEGNPPRQP
jgi:hypothetical protein